MKIIVSGKTVVIYPRADAVTCLFLSRDDAMRIAREPNDHFVSLAGFEVVFGAELHAALVAELVDVKPFGSRKKRSRATSKKTRGLIEKMRSRS